MKRKMLTSANDILNVDTMVEKSYSGINSLIVKDLDDNVFFLCYGVYLVNGKVQSSTLSALKSTFNRVIAQSQWCEFDGKVYQFYPSVTPSS